MTVRRFVVVGLLAVGALVVGSCSDSTDETATTGTIDPALVVFGSGEIPATVPDDFPIPAQAIIGTTLVDANRDFTQVVLRARTSLDEVVAYFEQNLTARGWELPRSEAAGVGWEIDFSRDDATGLIMIEEPDANIAQMVIEFGGSAG